MKKISTLTAALVAVAALAAAPLILAGPRHGMGRMGRMGGMSGGRGGGEARMHGDAFGILGHLEHIREELDLTDAQGDQMKAIFHEMHEKNAPLREQMQGRMHDATRMLLDNPANTAQAQALLDEQASAERALRTNILNATAKAFTVLNAEQRTKLREIMDERAERRERRRR